MTISVQGCMCAVSASIPCSRGRLTKNHFELLPYIFSSEKYEHHTPWPAFKNPIYPDSLAKELETEPQESSDGVALKVTCGKCGNPLGHEFLKDGPGGVGSRF